MGGKLEADESPLEAAVRELQEESGLALCPSAFIPIGTLSFPNFKPHKSEDWMVTVFEARVTEAERHQPLVGPEGSLHWVNASEVLGLPTWPGDREFLPRVLAREPFCGTIWYRGREVERVWITDFGASR